jgi:hypothetical protein
MLGFQQFLDEKNSYPVWVKGSVLIIVARIRSLSARIEKETDTSKKLNLLALQNRLLGYVSGLSIAIDTSNKSMMTKLKSSLKK